MYNKVSQKKIIRSYIINCKKLANKRLSSDQSGVNSGNSPCDNDRTPERKVCHGFHCCRRHKDHETHVKQLHIQPKHSISLHKFHTHKNCEKTNRKGKPFLSLNQPHQYTMLKIVKFKHSLKYSSIKILPKNVI